MQPLPAWLWEHPLHSFAHQRADQVKGWVVPLFFRGFWLYENWQLVLGRHSTKVDFNQLDLFHMFHNVICLLEILSTYISRILILCEYPCWKEVSDNVQCTSPIFSQNNVGSYFAHCQALGRPAWNSDSEEQPLEELHHVFWSLRPCDSYNMNLSPFCDLLATRWFLSLFLLNCDPVKTTNMQNLFPSPGLPQGWAPLLSESYSGPLTDNIRCFCWIISNFYLSRNLSESLSPLRSRYSSEEVRKQELLNPRKKVACTYCAMHGQILMCSVQCKLPVHIL